MFMFAFLVVDRLSPQKYAWNLKSCYRRTMGKSAVIWCVKIEILNIKVNKRSRNSRQDTFYSFSYSICLNIDVKIRKYSTCVIWCQTYFPFIVNDTHFKWIDKREQIISSPMWGKVDIIDAVIETCRVGKYRNKRIWNDVKRKVKDELSAVIIHFLLVRDSSLYTFMYHARRLSDCWWSSESRCEMRRTKTTSAFSTSSVHKLACSNHNSSSKATFGSWKSLDEMLISCRYWINSLFTSEEMFIVLNHFLIKYSWRTILCRI